MDTAAHRQTRHGVGWHFVLLLGRAATWVDQRVPWHRVPLPLGLVMLLGIRSRLRKENLFYTGTTTDQVPSVPEFADGSYLTARTVTGYYNDLELPSMGSVGCRFGRNMPPGATFPDNGSRLMTPNPRTVSRELLTRTTFLPAESLNLLAAAWLQFEVHDWFGHPKPSWETPHKLELGPDDDWPENPMRVPRAIPDPTWDGSEGAPPTWVNEDTHWWDGSQVYGDTRGIADGLRAREHGKLLIDDDGLPPAALEAGLDPSGVAGNFWLGLGLLHGLFMREHNAICDLLRKDNPGWGDDRLYRTARLINAALMAKIHTVEWTPGIIAHPTTVRAMRTTWWGIAGEGVHNRFGRISGSDLISGIPGSRKNLFEVPYALTEEFGAVYRMHPLIPDDYTFRSAADDSVLAQNTFQDLMLPHVRERMHTLGMGNALYSFGRSHPGAITLHNYPRFLQHLERPDGTILDLAAVDILRSRERGVRRYNEFRRQLHLKPVASFEELTPNPEWQSELRRVYDNDLEMVDLSVGLFAETPPPGMGFSDTAFRIFALMAPRRIASDRFLTDDYRPEIYTAAGLDWIDDNTMKSVLLRHFPELEPALRDVTNAFAPWRAVH
jgi:hypothetical protein